MKKSNFSLHKIHIDLTFALSRYFSPMRAFKTFFYQLIGVTGDIDLTGTALLFHLRGQVYRIAPDIIGEFFAADHARDNGPGMYTDPDLEFGQVLDFLRGIETAHKFL